MKFKTSREFSCDRSGIIRVAVGKVCVCVCVCVWRGGDGYCVSVCVMSFPVTEVE